MGKPQASACTAIVRHKAHTVRVARFGRAPLLHLWVHKDGEGGTGIVLDFAEAEELIEGMNVLLDEIEMEEWSDEAPPPA